MTITVAIPCYNLEDRIAVCLGSIICQDCQEIEILVIDDCSTDHSVDVINSVIDKHPERDIRLIINETNIGLCKVRNIAINEAKGEYLFFVDGDDSIEQGTISLFKQRMEQTHVDVVCGSFRKRDFDGNTYIIKQFPEDTLIGKFAYASYIEKYVCGYFNLGIWNNLYRLDFLKSNGIYCNTNYRIYEDRLFTFMVILYASSVSYIHEVTYN
jgi:glycosyltransferase involved in cell wall biosynthesis